MKTAFPTKTVQGRSTVDDLPAQQGMSLREYYAGQALAGLLANSFYLKNAIECDIGGFVEKASELSFDFAESMLKESNK